MSFVYQKEISDKVLTLTFDEVIDEGFEIPMLELAGFARLNLDMSKVNVLNSEGTRQLTKWFWEVGKTHPKLDVRLLNLPPVVARQFIALGTLVPEEIKIESVIVPYYCEACDEEVYALTVNSAQVAAGGGPGSFQPPPQRCKTCSAEMELDVTPERYFGLLVKS